MHYFKLEKTNDDFLNGAVNWERLILSAFVSININASYSLSGHKVHVSVVLWVENKTV